MQANKMVATERIRRAETEEELKETRLEKEALKCALRVVEGENGRLRNARPQVEEYTSHSRSSSRAAIKSRPSSVASIPSSLKSLNTAHEASSTYPPSPPPEPSESNEDSPGFEIDSDLTPQEVSQIPEPRSRVVDEQQKRKPERLKSASLFPNIPFTS